MLKTLIRTAGILLAIFLFRGAAFGQFHEVYLDSDSTNVINRISFFSANEGYVAFTNWIGHTTDSGKTFTRLFITNNNVNYNGYSVNLTFGFEIAGVKAFDRNTLIAYGDYGLIPAILYSSNAGTTWILVFQSQYSLGDFNGGITDMLFPQNDNTGYAIDADRILKTSDGGHTWNVLAIAGGSFFNHLEAVDDNIAFAMTTSSQTNKLLRTTDGGASWQAIPFPSVSGGVMTYAYFLNATTGWMSLYDGDYNLYFYKTSNSGTNWTLQNNVNATPFGCSKMHFVDENTGFALVTPFQVYKTLNSGVLWEPLARDNNFTYLGFTQNDLQCFSANQIWAGGGHGYLEMSENGGGTPIPTAYFRVDTSNENATGIVNLVNYSNPAYQFKWYVNNSLESTTYNSTYLHNLSRFADTIQLVVTSGGISDTVTKYQYFRVPNLPVISSFAPQGGGAGTFVTIYGSGFSGVTTVTFGGISATGFSILSDNVITATVAGGATGAVTVTDIHGTYSLGGFTFLPPPAGSPPSITAVAPSAGIVGTTVTISGTGFGATAAANKVFFGTIRANIQSASPTSIVCTVPAGASFDRIFVNNSANGLTAQSPRQFNISFADSSNFTPSSFSTAFTASYDEYTEPLQLMGKDIDGDGKPDLLVYIRGFADSVYAYRNTSRPGTLSFAPKLNIGTQANLLSNGKFTVNDIDGDGLPDIVAITGSNYITAIRNASTPGAISFKAEVNLPTGGNTSDLVIVDLDNDGRNDIAVAAYESGVISVIRNTGGPGIMSFAATQSVVTGGNPISIAAGDLDGDGRKDVIVYQSNGNLSIFRNISASGNIEFSSKTDIPVPGGNLQGNFIAIADYDGDGLLDVIVLNDNNLCIFRNISTLGNIAFDTAIVTPLNNIGHGSSMSNFGGGTLPDILFGDFYLSNFLLFRNVSTQGSIHNNPPFPLPGSYSYYTNGADFDGDGKSDIATAYSNNHSIAVLKNATGVLLAYPVCVGNPVASVLSSDMTGIGYQWQRNTGSGFVNLSDNDTLSGTTTASLSFIHTPSAWNGYKYRCLVDGLYSSIFMLQTDSLTFPGVELMTNDSVSCYGTTATFTATDLAGGANYTFKWLVNGSVTGPTTNQFVTTTLEDKSKVQVVLSYTNACGFHGDTSRIITMKVTEVPDSVSISTPTLSACTGTPVVFTATPVNAGPNPTYTWTINTRAQPETGPVFTSSSLSPVLPNNVQAILNGSIACGFPKNPTSNIVSENIIQSLSAAASVFVNTTTICQGDNLTFSASAINTGSGTTYQWRINDIDTGPNSYVFSTTSLHDNDTVQCMVAGNMACVIPDSAISLPIVITVNPIPGQPTISSDANGLVASVGSSYQWYMDTTTIIPGANEQHYKPATGGYYSVRTTENGCTSPFSGKYNYITTAVINVGGANQYVQTAPNPASDFLWITFNLSGIYTLEMDISDLNGRHVATNTSVHNGDPIDISVLARGMYFVRFRTHDGKINASTKMIKL